MSNINKDISACEEKLGKEPVLSAEEKRSVEMSDSITERLKTGVVDADRLDNYDNYWIDKLACIDESHSVRNNLDIAEAETTLKNLTKYAESGKIDDPESIESQQMDRDKVKNCLEMSRGETLQCEESIQQFIQQVDRSMYEAVRKDLEPPPSDRKLSYAEKFKRSYRM